MPDLAKIAYEAWCWSKGETPDWANVSQSDRDAWDAVAQRVLHVVDG